MHQRYHDAVRLARTMAEPSGSVSLQTGAVSIGAREPVSLRGNVDRLDCLNADFATALDRLEMFIAALGNPDGYVEQAGPAPDPNPTPASLNERVTNAVDEFARSVGRLVALNTAFERYMGQLVAVASSEEALSRDGAHQLRRTIQLYWAQRGYRPPEVTVSEIARMPGLYQVRSDMLNGEPREKRDA